MLSNLLTAFEYQHSVLPLAHHCHDLAKLNDLAVVLYPCCGMPPLAWPYHDFAKLNDLVVVLDLCHDRPPLAQHDHDLAKLNDLCLPQQPNHDGPRQTTTDHDGPWHRTTTTWPQQTMTNHNIGCSVGCKPVNYSTRPWNALQGWPLRVLSPFRRFPDNYREKWGLGGYADANR